MFAFSGKRCITQRVERIGMRAYGEEVEDRLQQIRQRQHHSMLVQQRRRALEESQLSGTVDASENRVLQPQHFAEDEWTYSEDNGDAPQRNGADMSTHDRILYYAMYIQHFGLSNEEISRMEELMAVLYGAPPPISYHGHVESLYQEILHDYDNHRYFFCSSCSESMAESRNACDNEECSIRGQNIKRAKKMQRIEVQVISSIPQLSDVLVRDIEKIIEMHARLHRREQNHERNDVRLFDGYYQNIETRDAFENNHLRVLLSLSIDGFRPRRLSKREIWPLYLRIDCLPQNEANNYYNSILAGTIQSRMKPTEKVLETLFSRLESELHDLRDSPIEIDVGGTSWLVEVKLYKGVADMAAQQVLFGVPRWNAEYGCSKCYIKGTRIQNSRIWIPGSDADTVLRSRESYIEDAELGQYGISKITSAMRLLPPCEFLADALHVCSEGITRDRMRDLFSSKTKFPGLRVSRESVEKVKQSLLGISNHTYANSLILSLDDMKTCKAAEVDELAFVVFPLVVAVGIVPCPIAATALLGYWMCIKIISKSLTLTVSSIETVKLIAQHTREISIIEAPEIFTMKCHWFFDHAMEEEITNFGTAYQWSSCPFESHHRRLQIRVNQSTTNSASVIIEKYLLSKRVRTLFHAQCANGNESMLALKEKVDNNHRKRFPVDIKISESIYIPKNSRVNSSELREPEKTRILRSGEEPYSRIVVRGKVFSSRLYWTRTKSSRQDLIYLDGDDGNESFGSALLFLYNRRTNTARVLLEEYNSCDPFSHLHDLVNHFPNTCRRIALALMREIRSNNCYFRELTATVTRVKCVSKIRGACQMVTYEGHTFISRS